MLIAVVVKSDGADLLLHKQGIPKGMHIVTTCSILWHMLDETEVVQKYDMFVLIHYALK